MSSTKLRVASVGVGLGLRWEFLEQFAEQQPLLPFIEVSPENYLGRGCRFPELLEQIGDRLPILTHGLSLGLGATEDADSSHLQAVRAELGRLDPAHHSEHLCFSRSGDTFLHELLPIPFDELTVDRVSDRLRSYTDLFQRPVAMENISYYACGGVNTMPEAEFIHRVLDKSGAGLLLDVNNVYVNSLNYGFDAESFIRSLPLSRVLQIHVAGHTRFEPDWVVDNHGAAVCDPVLDLLALTLAETGPVPVLLERDHNIPLLDVLLAETSSLQKLYDRVLGDHVLGEGAPS